MHAAQFLDDMLPTLTKPIDLVKLKFIDEMVAHFDEEELFNGLEQIKKVKRQHKNVRSDLSIHFHANPTTVRRIGSIFATLSVTKDDWLSVRKS